MFQLDQLIQKTAAQPSHKPHHVCDSSMCVCVFVMRVLISVLIYVLMCDHRDMVSKTMCANLMGMIWVYCKRTEANNQLNKNYQTYLCRLNLKDHKKTDTKEAKINTHTKKREIRER